MLTATAEVLSVGLESSHDGNYWVLRSPELGLVAAHQKLNTAWLRAVRMVIGQVVCALETDPSMAGLFADPELAEERGMLQAVRTLKAAGRFDLRISTEVDDGARGHSGRKTMAFDYPELACA